MIAELRRLDVPVRRGVRGLRALGRRGANVSFCRWLLDAARSGADVRVMFHEPYFYFGLQRPWRNVLAIAQRGMAALLLRSASAVYVSSDSWRRCLEPYGPMEHALTLPIFATVPEHRGRVDDVKRRWIGDSPSPLIGHFGTFGDHVARALRQVLPRILSASPSARVLLIGRNSERFAAQWRATARSSPERVLAAGALEPAAIAAALQACDVVLQPYPDGVTTRRTSVMAALRNGCPTVTTEGRLTEDVWRATRAAVLVRHGDAAAFADACAALLADAGARQAAAFRARAAYRAQFSIEHTIERLRGAADAKVAAR